LIFFPSIGLMADSEGQAASSIFSSLCSGFTGTSERIRLMFGLPGVPGTRLHHPGYSYTGPGGISDNQPDARGLILNRSPFVVFCRNYPPGGDGSHPRKKNLMKK
jgi:hypothetical protein